MKGSSSMQEEMNQEEMQRFLNREAERGSSEYEALKAFLFQPDIKEV